MVLLIMKLFNSSKEYGLLAKLFHWVTFVALIIQIPFGFYLVGLDFSDRRIDLENIFELNWLFDFKSLILLGFIIGLVTLFLIIVTNLKFLSPKVYPLIRNQ